jgi:hypothetical protein
MRLMTHALPPLNQAGIEALAASAIAWMVRLLGVLTALGATRRRRLMRRFLNHIERAVECIIFLKAVARLGPSPRRRRHPRSVPKGFRRTLGSRRLFWKSARIRARGADAFTRIARLLEALANPQPFIARFMRRFSTGVSFHHLVPCAPPGEALVSLAFADARFADSS